MTPPIKIPFPIDRSVCGEKKKNPQRPTELTEDVFLHDSAIASLNLRAVGTLDDTCPLLD